jgi:putative transcriptional regulator
MPRTLKEIRNEKSIGQQFMAERLGISKAHYCNIENGKRGLSYPMAVAISKILDVPIQDIFFEHQDDKMKTATL